MVRELPGMLAQVGVHFDPQHDQEEIRELAAYLTETISSAQEALDQIQALQGYASMSGFDSAQLSRLAEFLRSSQ